MHDISKRITTLGSYTFMFTVVLLCCIFLESGRKVAVVPNCDFALNSYSFKSEVSRFVSISPNIDLSSQFHINVKQIFLYVKIIYGQNSDIIWSTIVKKNSEKKIFESYFNNYRTPIVKSGNIKIELRGCIFPFVGKITDVLYSQKVIKLDSIENK